MDSTPPARMTSALPAADAVGGQRDGLQAGGAEAVDGHSGNGYRQSGAKGRDFSDVHALLGLGHGAAQDNVFDLF